MRAVIFLSAILLGAYSFGVEVSPISVRVEQTVGNASDRARHHQSKALKVHVSNASTADVSGLVIKYYYIGKSLPDGDPKVLEEGERKARVQSHGSVAIEIPEIKTVYNEEHGKRVDGKGGKKGPKGKGADGKKNPKYKTVDASGTKLLGYGVKVLSGDKVVAESFSEPGFKSLAP